MKESIILVTLLYLFTLNAAVSQKKEVESVPLNNGVILNEMHRESIGEIAFMEDFIPFDSFTASDFKTEVQLSRESDLNIRFFMARTLTSYLHDLAPKLSVEELCASGNFMFTFLVDQALIYQFKVPFGAGSCDYKNEQTVYGVPFIHKDNPDHWGRFLWQRFMHHGGGEEALSVGDHELTIRIKAYLKQEESLISDVIAEGSVTVVRAPIVTTSKQKAIQQIKKSKWPLYTKAFDTTRIETLNELIANETFKDITSIVVLKDGKLALEEYFNGANRKTLHDTRSLTKSFTSTLMGMAIDDGFISSEKASLDQFYDLTAFENFSEAKANITIDDLLQMSSSFEGNDADQSSPGNEENMYPSSDWLKFVLDLPLTQRNPTKQWQYFTGGVVLLGDILDQQTHGLEEYAEQKLFKPLSIRNVKWQYTPSGVVNTAGSCQLAALDYAKYGQLYLNDGQWEGEQIVPEYWIKQSLTKHQKLDFDNQYYGYLFWNRTLTLGDKSYDTYRASGNGGNHMVIIKELNMVIVITATAYNRPYAHPQSNKIIASYLLPAFIVQSKDR